MHAPDSAPEYFYEEATHCWMFLISCSHPCARHQAGAALASKPLAVDTEAVTKPKLFLQASLAASCFSGV